ncbi:MAG: cytochrome c-type biogenesis protein [Dongia sp.]
MIRALWLVLIVLLAGGALDVGDLRSAAADQTIRTADQPLSDPVLEARARALMREIRCVVCQSQSIDESDAEIAAQLRNAIREQMAAGKSPDEIRDFLVARYGDFVLLKPPFKASTLLLWAGPFILVAIGLGIILLQHRQKSRVAAGNAALTPPELSESERNRVQRILRGEDTP